MDKEYLRKMLQDFGVALAENLLPLTFFVGGDVEFGRVDILNKTKPGKVLKKILAEETAKSFGITVEDVDELLMTYYLMTKTSVLVEHTAKNLSSGHFQKSINRGIFTLDEDEIKEMYKLHHEDVPDKALRDWNNAVTGIIGAYNINKIKGVRLDWQRCKTTNPRSLMDYDNGVHIIPVDVLVGYQDKLRELARTQILKFTYKRVNTSDRVQYVTLSKDVIDEVYKKDLKFANDFFER